MKNHIKTIIATIMVGVMAGCATINEWFQKIDTDKLEFICAAAETTSCATTIAVIQANGADAKLAFQITSEVITAAIDAKNYEPELLRKLISEKLEGNPYGALAITGLNTVITAYKTFYNKNWNDTEGAELVCYKFLTAINNGIKTGLQAVGKPNATKAAEDKLSKMTAEELKVIYPVF